MSTTIQLPSVYHARYSEHDEGGRAPIEDQDVVLIRHIAALFKEVEAAYAKLSSNATDAMLDFHSEDHHVPHCVRWGAQNIQEVLEALIEEAA